MHFRDFGGLGVNASIEKFGNFVYYDLQSNFRKFIFFKCGFFQFYDEFIIFIFHKIIEIENRSTIDPLTYAGCKKSCFFRIF